MLGQLFRNLLMFIGSKLIEWADPDLRKKLDQYKADRKKLEEQERAITQEISSLEAKGAENEELRAQNATERETVGSQITRVEEELKNVRNQEVDNSAADSDILRGKL